MSHVVTIKTQVRDVVAIQSCCERLKLPRAEFGKRRLFNAEVEGWCVQLPNWKYHVVCDIDQGVLQFDNFNGRWGDQSELDRFVQGYAVEKAKLEARKQGDSVTEQQLADGSIRLQIAVTASA